MSSPSTSMTNQLSSNLARLNRLLRNGLITKDEKAIVKNALLGSNSVDDELRNKNQTILKGFDLQSDGDFVDLIRSLIATDGRDRVSSSEVGSRIRQLNLGPAHNFTILFHAKEMEDIAKECVVCSSHTLILGKIDWERFDEADGWPKVFIHGVNELQYHDVMFLASFHSPAVVFEQLSGIFALARLG